MIQPIIHDNLTQIFVKHYKMQPRAAAQEAMRFLEIVELYGMQIIIGDWLIPEPSTPQSPWQRAIEALQEAEAREPWLAKEIQ